MGHRQQLSTGLQAGWSRDRNPLGWGGGIFCILPDQPRSPPSLLHNGYWVSLPGAKWPGRGFNHQPPSSTKLKERVQLYIYSPFGPLWPVVGSIYLWLPSTTGRRGRGKKRTSWNCLQILGQYSIRNMTWWMHNTVLRQLSITVLKQVVVFKYTFQITRCL